MKKTLIYLLTVMLGFSITAPISAEKECKKHAGKQCDKKTCKRKHKHGRKMFHMMDSNKDKKISKVEWNTHFDKVDADKDGNLTPEEVKQFHKSKHKKHH